MRSLRRPLATALVASRSTLAALGVAAAILAVPAIARGDTIFEANANPNVAIGTIGEYTTSGATVNASLITGLTEPAGIAVSGSDLFVADSFNGTLGEYTTSGATVNASLAGGAFWGIAVSGSNLFVTNLNSGTVGEYTTSGATVNASLITGLNTPAGIAVDGSDLFVYSVGTVGEYTTSGATVNASLISGLSTTPYGIAVSGSNLFVTNGNVIGEYTTSGATVNPSLVSGVSGARSIAVSGSDIFVGVGNTIGEYTTSGATVNASLITQTDHVVDGIVVVPVPEPATALLLLSGLAGLAVRRHLARGTSIGERASAARLTARTTAPCGRGRGDCGSTITTRALPRSEESG